MGVARRGRCTRWRAVRALPFLPIIFTGRHSNSHGRCAVDVRLEMLRIITYMIASGIIPGSSLIQRSLPCSGGPSGVAIGLCVALRRGALYGPLLCTYRAHATCIRLVCSPHLLNHSRFAFPSQCGHFHSSSFVIPRKGEGIYGSSVR